MDIGDFGMRADSMLSAIPDPDRAGRELAERLTDLRGHGESADGRVRAEANGQGAIIALEIDPRVLRRGTEEVTALTREAVNAALADVRQHTDEQISAALGPLADLTQRINQDFTTVLSRARPTPDYRSCVINAALLSL